MKRLKVLSAGAVKRGVSQLSQAYAAQRGFEVSVEFATAPELRKRMTGGETPGVLVAPPALMDDLASAGRISAGSRSFIGRSRIGVVVHATSVRDVPDEPALRKLLTEAPTVVRTAGSSGVYTATLFQKYGIDPERIFVGPTGAAAMEYVGAHPEAVGLAQISEIRVLVEKGCPVRLAAPLPDAVQHMTSYEAAAVIGCDDLDAAAALAHYMATPEAKKVFAATGID